MLIQVEENELLKIKDALVLTSVFFTKRDEMNAAVHGAFEVGYSYITSIVQAQIARIDSILPQSEKDKIPF